MRKKEEGICEIIRKTKKKKNSFHLRFHGGENKGKKNLYKYLELLPLNWWTWASTFLKSTLGWSLYEGGKKIQRKRKPQKQQTFMKHSKVASQKSILWLEKRKRKTIQIVWKMRRVFGKEEKRKLGSLDPYRALVRSFKSFSESSKKRYTTSTTKSGLLSSWSCCSCRNCPSRNPFSHQKRKGRTRRRRTKIKTKTNSTKIEKNKKKPSRSNRKRKQTHMRFMHIPYIFRYLTSKNKDFV